MGWKEQVLQVHLAKSNEDRRRLYEFRYRVHVEELGLEPQGTFHKLRAVRDDFDVNAELYFLTDENEIVGSVRVLVCDAPLLPRNLVEAYDLRNFSAFDAAKLCLSDHFIIAADWRQTAASSVMLGAKYKQLRSRGIKFDFCNVTPALVELFQKLGYRRFTKNFVDPIDGLRTPLVLVVEDIEHLTTVKSPFALIADEFENSPEDTKWLLREYPDAAAADVKELKDEEQLWEHITDRLHQAPLVGIPLFTGMEVADAQRLIKNGLTINLNAGENLLQMGDLGNEMYIILSGMVEVERNGKLIATLGPGSVIGEISFLAEVPRTANVSVVQDGEFFVLTQEMFQKIMKSMPELAARALFNLSMILCERLQNSTRSWVDGVTDLDDLPI